MKAKLALVAAIALGIVAAVGVHRWLQTQERKTTEQIQPTMVLAYAKRLERGSILTPESLRTKQVPSAAVTSVTVVERDIRRVYGQRLVRDVETNQTVQWDDFEERRTGLAEGESGLQPGQRAITVGVDSVSGVAGNIRPGSHVDIFGTFQLPAEESARAGERSLTTKTVLLLSDVPVLATDNRTTLTQYALADRRQSGSYSTVTVAATPRESLMLIYAQQFGKVTFALRSDGDVLPSGDLPGISEAELLSFAEELEAQRRERRQRGRNAVE